MSAPPTIDVAGYIADRVFEPVSLQISPGRIGVSWMQGHELRTRRYSYDPDKPLPALDAVVDALNSAMGY